MLISLAGLPAKVLNRTSACPPEARVLEVGEFHGEEVVAKSGEKWLGLYISDGASMLLNYHLTVETVHDSLVDNADEKTGKKVSVDLPLEPIFLVDADWLSAGQVQTVLEGRYENALDRSVPLSLKLAGVSYELKIIGSEEGEKCTSEGLPKNARLVLASRESGQALYTLEECGNDPRWHLIWAGDLDGDEKLDLYVSVNQHYNVAEKKLFLSSAAVEGRLVEEVATFVISGC